MKNSINSVKVIETTDWKKEVLDSIVRNKILNPLIVTSDGTASRNNLGMIFSDYTICNSISPNPTISYLNHIISNLSKNFDCVIAIGGGSVLDSAKVIIASLATNIKSVEQLIKLKDKIDINNSIYSLFIPTTHGTGSEVTMWATVWDNINKKKYSVSHPELYPKNAIIDPALCQTLPFKDSISTTLDSLSHSFESLWNNNSEPKSTDAAKESICIIIDNIDSIVGDVRSLKFKKELLKSSCLAGQAMSSTKTAAAHSMSYPLTIYHEIPHGIAASFFLNEFIDLTYQKISKDIDEIISRCKLQNIDELKEKISSLLTCVNGNKLSNWGISKNNIYQLVEKSITKGRMDNFIIKLSKKNIESIYFKYL